MSSAIRCVVIQNDINGKSVVADDAAVPTVAPGPNIGIIGAELWSTDMMPVDNSVAAGIEQKSCVIKKHGGTLFVGNGQGSAFRITDFPAGHAKISHRIETLDYRRHHHCARRDARVDQLETGAGRRRLYHA